MYLCDLRSLESHIVSLSFSVLAIISQTAIKPVAYKELKYVLTAVVAKSSKTQGLVNSVSGEEQFLLIRVFYCVYVWPWAWRILLDFLCKGPFWAKRSPETLSDNIPLCWD